MFLVYHRQSYEIMFPVYIDEVIGFVIFNIFLVVKAASQFYSLNRLIFIYLFFEEFWLGVA